MRRAVRVCRLAVLAAAVAVPAAAAAPPTGFVHYSDPETVGYQGEHAFLDSSGATVYTQALGDGVHVRFEAAGVGGDIWEFEIHPAVGDTLAPGFYSGGAELSRRDENHPSMEVKGPEGTGAAGTFEVRDIALAADGTVARLWVLFVVQGRFGPATFGELRVNAPASDGAAHATPGAVRWPSADLGRVPTTIPVRVAPTGGAVSLASVGLAGDDPASFSVQQDGCSGASLSSGALCEVRVAYRPTAPGTHTATLRVTDGGGGALEVPLEGYTYGGTTHFVLESDPGDFVGQGQRYEYTPADGFLEAGGSRAYGGFAVHTTQDYWYGVFYPPPGGELAPGTYSGARRYPYNGADPGLTVGGNGRECSESGGDFTLHHWELDADGYASEIVYSFVQRCNQEAAAFRGRIEFRSGNGVPPPPWGLPYRVAGAPAPPGDTAPPPDGGGTQPPPGGTVDEPAPGDGPPAIPPAATVRRAACRGMAFPPSAVRRGTLRADVMTGGRRAQLFVARRGNDRISARGGADCVLAGRGADRVSSGRGNDVVVAGPGRDLVDCGRGRDRAVVGKRDRTRRCERVVRR